VDLRAISDDQPSIIRVCHIHKNEPGVLKRVNEILGNHNVEKQYSDSKGDIAYVMADISDVSSDEAKELLEQLSLTKSNIGTRLLM